VWLLVAKRFVDEIPMEERRKVGVGKHKIGVRWLVWVRVSYKLSHCPAHHTALTVGK
jgi:hypothetical protein